MKKILLLFTCTILTIPIWGQIVAAKSAGYEKWGFVDANDNWVIQPIYESTYWYEKWNLGIFRNKFGGPEGLLDSSGKVIFPIGKYKGYYYSRNCITLTDMNEKKGVATLSGDVIIPCQYEEIYIDKNGYIEVRSNGLHGLWNQGGHELIPCKYDWILQSMLEKYNYCYVKQNGKTGIYDVKKKKELLPCIFDYISFDEKTGHFKVEQDEKYGLYSLEGKMILSCKYDYLSFDEKIGHIRAEQSGKKGLYTLEGKEIIPCEHDYLSFDKKTGFIKAEQKGKNGLYSLEGKEIIPCKFEYIWDLYYKESGCFRVELNNKEGVYNDKGEMLLQCIYSDVYMNEDYITFSSNDKGGLYSIKEKRILLEPFYDYLSLPSEGLILYKKNEDGKYGYLDLKGNIVIEPQYDKAESFKDGIAQVTKNGVTSIIKHPLNGTNLNITSGEDVWVDIDIPITSRQNDEAFAFIIANENYAHFSGADYSHNDGKVFAEYCKNTLGMPESNVRYYEDATFGNIANALKQLMDIADVYDGDAKIVFYFSGLGITDDKTNERYILPSDASLTAFTSTGYKVTELMSALNQLKSQYTMLIVDAPFNGNDKNGKPLISGRGVRIASKQIPALNNVIGLIGSDDGKDFSSKQLQHSILTYSLLEKLKSSKGDCSISELFHDSCKKTKTESLKLFKDVQSPGIILTNDVITNQKI